ncbi:MAG: S8 family serine peptidase [Phycisphaerales bacterium]|nr:S8 family serine peptidase [Phycisphaerales bacterium]
MIKYISTTVIAFSATFGSIAVANPQQNGFAITLGEETFDPITKVIVNPTEWEFSSQFESDLRLIQFDGPIQESWIDLMRESGISPVQYIHPFTYITWSDQQSRDNATDLPNVRWSGDFLNGYRVLPKWRNLDAQKIATQALFYKGADNQRMLKELTKIGAVRIEQHSLDNRFNVISFVTSGSSYLDISTIPGIYTIQPKPTDGGLRSEMSNQINAGNFDADNMAYPGYQDWLTTAGVNGQGVTIAIVDGGSDDEHVDLAGQFVPCVGQSCGGGSSSSHGTHTAGIVGATGTSGTTDSYGFLRGQGVAPSASLVEQKYSPLFQQPGGMTLLMVESHSNGAIASSNSWGPSGSPQGYDIDTLEVDVAIRDADPSTNGNQQFSYVLAIMNGYGGTSSQGSPDEAKNIFTIGSTKMQYSDGSQYPEINDLSSNSAHGPCLDGRTIPHMVAPGCSVDSTVPSSYGLMCGTSMACPQVAGGIALFVEQYRNAYGDDPSPALIKAAFTAAAIDLAGNDDADGNTLGHVFDSKQGWGRMDLSSVLINPEGSVRYYDAPVVLEQTGDEWSATVSPLDPSQPMKIMLVWTDALGHGLGGSTPAWNNDLDLTVTAGMSTYLGNNIGSQGWSTTGGTADGMNNTEGVFLGPTPPSQATIVVSAANLNSDGIPNEGDDVDQDFSVVCYNCASEPGFSISINPSSQSVCAPSSVDYTVSVGQIMGYNQEITLSANLYPGLTAAFSENPVLPGNDVTMTLSVDSSVFDETYGFTVRGTSADQSHHDASAQVEVSSSIPGVSTLLQPLNGTTDVPLSPTFRWVTGSGGAATSWHLQVSTTQNEFGIVYDNSDIDTTVFQLPMMLESNTPYFWRINASNNCGVGGWTSWWTFRTTDAMVVLLVDDDDNSPDVRSYYTSMLDEAGLLYDIYDTNNSDNEPEVSELQGYPLVIWFSGDEFGGFAGPGNSGEGSLSTYIDSGGYLVLSSQDYLYDNGLTDFGSNYLGIYSYDSDEYQTTVTGVGLFEDMGTASLSYPFANWSDIVSPTSQAQLSFSGNMGDAGTHFEGSHGGGAVFLGFPIEAFSSADQSAFMTSVLTWTGDNNSEPCPSDCNGDGTVDVIDILEIISGWGTGSGCDVNADGTIDILDLLYVVGSWGECP